MAICPKCKKVIRELYMRRTGTEDARMYVDKGGVIDIDEEEFESDGEASWYNCPKCNEELFEDWDKAEEFLMDKDEFTEMVAEKVEKIKGGKNKDENNESY